MPGDLPHLLDPRAELRQEDLGGHGHRQLPPLHRFRPFVGRLQLRVHPLVGQEAGAVLGDAVSAHQAHRLAHHVGAVAGVPQLGRRAQHVGLGVLQHKIHQRIGLQLRQPWIVRSQHQQLDRPLLALAQRPHLRPLPLTPRSFRMAFFCFSSGSSSSNSRAAAKPSDAAASPVAHTSTSRCSASSRCWMPNS